MRQPSASLPHVSLCSAVHGGLTCSTILHMERDGDANRGLPPHLILHGKIELKSRSSAFALSLSR